MREIFLVVAILLIIIVLLQSGKAEAASQFISRLTMALGVVFFVLTIVMDVI